MFEYQRSYISIVQTAICTRHKVTRSERGTNGPGYSKSTAVCGEVNLPSFAADRKKHPPRWPMKTRWRKHRRRGDSGLGAGWFLATKLFLGEGGSCWMREVVFTQIFDRCLLNVYSCQWPPEVICWFNSCIYIRLSKMLRWCWRFVSFNHISDWNLW